LKIELNIPQSGFVPGQKIPVTALLANNTHIPVADVEFRLVMLVKYMSQSPRRAIVEGIKLSESKGEKILRNCTRSLTRHLLVPATPPTCTNLCSIIHIAYSIEVEAKMQGFHGNQMVTIPVTIGNVPLQQTSVIIQQPTSSNNALNNFQTPTLQTRSTDNMKDQNSISEMREDGIATIATAPIDLQSALSPDIRNLLMNSINLQQLIYFPFIAPPSYEESLHTFRNDCNEDVENAPGPMEFAPLYPVYSIPGTNELQPMQTNGAYDNQTFEK